MMAYLRSLWLCVGCILAGALLIAGSSRIPRVFRNLLDCVDMVPFVQWLQVGACH